MPDPSITPSPDAPIQPDRWAKLRAFFAEDMPGSGWPVTDDEIRDLLDERDRLAAVVEAGDFDGLADALWAAMDREDDLAAVLREMVDTEDAVVDSRTHAEAVAASEARDDLVERACRVLDQTPEPRPDLSGEHVGGCIGRPGWQVADDTTPPIRSDQTDDLVDRLRQGAKVLAGRMSPKVLLDAADEIERLRQEITEHRFVAETGARMLHNQQSEMNRLRAQAPPTAGEVLAHIAPRWVGNVRRGGNVEHLDHKTQEWRRFWIDPTAVAALRRVDPSTPQPGLRLVKKERTDV